MGGAITIAEWGLVIFTTAITAAVGAYLWATIMASIARARKTGVDLGINSLVALGLTVIGMLGSLLHLGTPLLAPYSVLNLGSSWLSREILFTSLFLVLLVVAIALDRTKAGSEGLRIGWAWATTIVGLIAVLSSAEVYMVTIMPAWQSWYILVTFYATTLVLGGMVFILTSRKALGDDALRLGLVMLAAVLLQLALLPNHLAGLVAGGPAAQATAALLSGTYRGVMAIGWVLVAGGAFLVVLSQVMRERAVNYYLYVAAAALIVGQVMDRWLFYAMKVAVAVGG
jgi:anaerobic dimethyl sulfoxide reductase subunit C (anchor subunit)